MMFILSNGDYFKLDFAMNAFDNISLYTFLHAIKRKGIEVNIPDWTSLQANAKPAKSAGRQAASQAGSNIAFSDVFCSVYTALK